MARALSIHEHIAMYPNPQKGPCAGCGATGYGLSMSGPSICPACDSQPPQKRVRQLADENRRLRERVAELEAALRESWGHTGPCQPGCNCDAARAGL